jgi:hypothetical protein
MTEKTVHILLGLILLGTVIYVASSLFFIDSQTDDVIVSTSVDNVAPTVDSVYISDSQYGLSDDFSGGKITGLNAGTTKEIHVNGVVSDLNDEEDIAEVAVVFYRSNHASTQSCDADDNDCYRDDTDTDCVLDTTYGNSTQARYDCQLDLQYFIDGTDSFSDNYSATNWTVWVQVTDNDSATDTDSSVVKDVETLLALDIPSSIDFGTRVLGSTTTLANNVEMLIGQFGNESADVEVSGTDLVCDGSDGSIPAANIQWSKLDLGHGQGNILSGVAADTDFDIGLRLSAHVNKKLFWNIQIPDYGVKGTCSGATTITTKRADE